LVSCRSISTNSFKLALEINTASQCKSRHFKLIVSHYSPRLTIMVYRHKFITLLPIAHHRG
jgi:hypothetical protein